jgi:uncharacterized RDD family membrane protein YckC
MSAGEQSVEKSIYAGFWIRTLASIIDTIIMVIPMVLFLTSIYPNYFSFGLNMHSDGLMYRGPIDVVVQLGVPCFYTILFWRLKGATPGKMIVEIKVVDAETLLEPSVSSLVGRYFAYFVSTIPLCLGFLWVAWGKDKRGFHDKLAGTSVIYPGRVK